VAIDHAGCTPRMIRELREGDHVPVLSGVQYEVHI